MKLTGLRSDHIYILRIKGSITKNNVAGYQHHMNLVFKDHDLQGVLINLEESPFIDSQGLGLLLKWVKLLKERDLKLSLCHVNKNVRFLMALMHLENHLDFFDTEKEAIHLIKAGVTHSA